MTCHHRVTTREPLAIDNWKSLCALRPYRCAPCSSAFPLSLLGRAPFSVFGALYTSVQLGEDWLRAALYWIVFIALSLTGEGKFSIDRQLHLGLLGFHQNRVAGFPSAIRVFALTHSRRKVRAREPLTPLFSSSC
jgi:hypothetical protein